MLSPYVLGWFPLSPNLAGAFIGGFIGLELKDGRITNFTLNFILLTGLMLFIPATFYRKYKNDAYAYDFYISAGGSLIFLFVIFWLVEYSGRQIIFGEKIIRYQY